MVDPQRAPLLSKAAWLRTTDLVAALTAGGPSALRASSTLPGWDRLTVVCHLRYGASASRRMTTEALNGRRTSFYPGGRSNQRAGTLVPSAGERPADVVASLVEESDQLQNAWAPLSARQWQTAIQEPAENPDLGRSTIALLALLRLTEVEIHGSDLDLGLSDWSDVFVANALPVRLGWVATRRSNHRPIARGVQGSWLLRAIDGPCWLVSVHGDRVASEPAEPNTPADAVIEGTGRDLLALLLGRPPRRALSMRGDTRLAGAFSEAFPGP